MLMCNVICIQFQTKWHCRSYGSIWNWGEQVAVDTYKWRMINNETKKYKILNKTIYDWRPAWCIMCFHWQNLLKFWNLWGFCILLCGQTNLFPEIFPLEEGVNSKEDIILLDLATQSDEGWQLTAICDWVIILPIHQCCWILFSVDILIFPNT